MNKRRKNEIKRIITLLEKLLDEEDAVRDNIPESLESSDIYQESEVASEQLEEAITALQEII